MKYSDGAEQSAEYLRLALPLMAQQDAAMHPVSYAVWYEYVSGGNPALKAEIDERLKSGQVLDEASTHKLYQAHVADLDEELAQQISAGFQAVMTEVSASAEQAGDKAGRFSDAVGRWSKQASAPGAARGQATEAVLGLAREMQDSIVALKDRLDASSREIEQLRHEVIKARNEARTDGLTGLTNRRGFEGECAACLARAAPEDTGPCLLLADIDHFKRINDSYGHLFGDKVLKAIARILQDNVKGRDTAARYGGEEFVILLPDTPLDGARHLAETIRAVVERCRIKRTADNGAVTNITISIGIASYRPGEPMSDFISRADAALYAAKDGGRNRVSVAG